MRDTLFCLGLALSVSACGAAEPLTHAPSAAALDRGVLYAHWEAPERGSYGLGSHVIDPMTGRLYLSEPVGPAAEPLIARLRQTPVTATELLALGASAIDVASGRVLWATAEPLAPLTMEGGVLIARAGSDVALISVEDGQRVGGCAAALGAEARLHHQARTTPHRIQDELFLVVSTTSQQAGGVARPADAIATSGHTLEAYALEVSGGTCSATPAELPPDMHDQWDLYRRADGSAVRFVLAGPDGRPDVVVGEGGADQVDVIPTADGGHVVVVDRGPTGARAVVRTLTGERVGAIEVPQTGGAFAVLASGLVVLAGYEVVAYDLATGTETWRYALPSRYAMVQVEPLRP